MKLLTILHSRYLIPENISNGQNFQTGHGLLKEAGIIAPICHIPHKIFDSKTFWQNISNGHNFQSHKGPTHCSMGILVHWFQHIRKNKFPFYACKQMIMSLKCHLRTAPKENKNIWGVVAVALSWTFILGKGSKHKDRNFSLRSYSNQYESKNCGEELILKKKLTTTSSCVVKL